VAADVIGRGAALLLVLAFLAPSSAVAQPPAATAEVRAAVTALYARYRAAPSADGSPASDDAVYSRRTRDLIARWHRSQPEDEVTPLGDFDWFCQCQDYDEKTFAVTALIVRTGDRAGTFEAAVRYDIGGGNARSLSLVMIREDRDWKVDDILFARETDIAGLRTQLATEIAETERQTRQPTGERP